MTTLQNILRSIVLTGVFSFILPSAVIGVLALGLYSLSIAPAMGDISQAGLQQMTYVLLIFGNGSAVAGLILINCVCSLVGILFDVFSFYRQQKLGNS
jgi:hypothetical protein